MGNIFFFKEDTNYVLRDKKKIRTWIEDCISEETMNTGAINFIICSDSYLLNINKKYLNHDYNTDVITFDYSEESEIQGDIFIGIGQIKKQSIDLDVRIVDELHRIMIHGVLHLLGYQDDTDQSRKLIRDKEDYYLAKRIF